MSTVVALPYSKTRSRSKPAGLRAWRCRWRGRCLLQMSMVPQTGSVGGKYLWVGGWGAERGGWGVEELLGC